MVDTKSKFLYHGSKVGGIKVLEPRRTKILKDMVVFATPSACFALAMIHGTSQDLDIGYIGSGSSQSDASYTMYIKELRPSALQLYSQPGFLYLVANSGFRADPALAHVERVSNKLTKVLREIKIVDVLEELNKYPIRFLLYSSQPSMDSQSLV